MTYIPVTSPLKPFVPAMSAPSPRLVSFNINGLAMALGPPKAEVTGSNPVGCANYFNNLASVSRFFNWLHPRYIPVISHLKQNISVSGLNPATPSPPVNERVPLMAQTLAFLLVRLARFTPLIPIYTRKTPETIYGDENA